MRRRCCFSVALATTFYEGAHFAGMARVLGVAFAVFLAWRKVPLIGVIIAAAVVTALLRGGYKLKSALRRSFDSCYTLICSVRQSYARGCR